MDSQVYLQSDNENCPSSAPLSEFTPMQMKIVDGVRSGQLNKQIAFDLGIAEATVKAHMTTIMRKLNVTNRTQVALAAQVAMFRSVGVR